MRRDFRAAKRGGRGEEVVLERDTKPEDMSPSFFARLEVDEDAVPIWRMWRGRMRGVRRMGA